MFKAKISVLGQKEFLKACAQALKPEAKFKTERGNFKLNLTSKLQINVEAKDAVAFKAILNTLTGLLAVAQQAWEKE